MKNKDFTETKIEIPEKISIFPLPNVILFPGIDLPLYIFEPRYRLMLKDCSAGNKFMGISLLRRGWEEKKDPVPSHDIVGVGYVRAIFENPDGTSYILLKGVCRARITRYLQQEPYRIAKVREIPDEVEDSEELKKLAGQIRKLLAQKLRYAKENPKDSFRMPKEFENPVVLSHLACFFSDADPYLKQNLFESPNCNHRMRHLVDILGAEIHPASHKN
jgi:Lon protease-like protein